MEESGFKQLADVIEGIEIDNDFKKFNEQPHQKDRLTACLQTPASLDDNSIPNKQSFSFHP